MNKTICQNINAAIKITKAIFQILYIPTDNPTCIWHRGTCFAIQYQNRIFVLTASHCIDESAKQDLFIANTATSKDIVSLPFVGSVKSYWTEGTNVDTDVRIFIVDQELINNEIRDKVWTKSYEKSTKDSISKMLSRPKVAKIMKYYIGKPEKALHKIKKLSCYKKLEKL